MIIKKKQIYLSQGWLFRHFLVHFPLKKGANCYKICYIFNCWLSLSSGINLDITRYSISSNNSHFYFEYTLNWLWYVIELIMNIHMFRPLNSPCSVILTKNISQIHDSWDIMQFWSWYVDSEFCQWKCNTMMYWSLVLLYYKHWRKQFQRAIWYS